MLDNHIDHTQEVKAADVALELALKHGAQQARISLNIGGQNSFSVLNGRLDRLQSANDRSIYIQLFADDRYGAYSTNRLEYGELERFISEAVKATRLLAPDTCRQLPPKELYYRGGGAGLNQFDPYILTMPPADKKAFAFEAAASIYGKNKKLISASAEYGDVLEYQYITDSQGFTGEWMQSNFSVSVECSVKGRGDARPEGWWYESTMQYRDFSIAGCGEKALERALAKLNPKKVAGAKMNMIVDRNCASRLVSPIISALNGANIQQKNSFLAGKLGEKVFSEKVHFIDTPHEAGMQGSRYFDSEGIATKNLEIIKDGVVNTYFINTYNAHKMGLSPTVEGPSVPRFSREGFAPEYQNLSGTDMLPLLGKGIFVTGFNGGNCNGGTGDFSFGIEGFYFENGTLLHPVKEMNISGNILHLWNNVIFVGNDARPCTRWQIPALAFEGVDFTGI